MKVVRGIATASQAETIRNWNIKYLDSPNVSLDEDTFLFIDEKDNCLGYANIIFDGKLWIDWFCAPRNGALCLKLLLEQLPMLYRCADSVQLIVSCDNGENEKAAQARLNLYFAHGFKIVRTLWVAAKQVKFVMQRELSF